MALIRHMAQCDTGREATACHSARGLAGGSARVEPTNLSDHIEQNIESVVELHRREWESVSPSQRRVEEFSRILGRPAYLLGLLMAIAGWIGINLILWVRGEVPWDGPPFELLDFLMTGLSLTTTTIVLIAQNRQTRRERQNAQLDLQLNLLTEQKVTKLIHLIEELRRDLPMVKDRHDPQAAVLQQRADTAQVLSALEKRGLDMPHVAKKEP